MFVLLTDQRALASDVVCQSCLMANQEGQPRWQEGKLLCGSRVQGLDPQSATLYECQMGFRLTRIHSD